MKVLVILSGLMASGLLGAAALSFTGSGSGAVAAEPMAAQNDDKLTVVELFTSQGCSSCPPADALASRMAKDPAILVITRPVTYWDRLGWKDTLGQESNTELQRAYAARGFAGAGVYTPQIVVGGRAGEVGSREKAIRTLVRQDRQQPGVDVKAIRHKDGSASVTVAGPESGLAAVQLLALDSHETVNIGRGENGGRTVHYTNVLKSQRNLGSWQGGTRQFTIPATMLQSPDADRYAITVQRPGAGPILGVAKIL